MNEQRDDSKKTAAKKQATKKRTSRKRPRWPFRLVMSAGAAFCVLAAFAMLYPVLREYYVANREYEHLMIEYAAVLERNVKMQEQVEYLKTPEGVEDRARGQFGWVKEGERAVNITGLNLPDSSMALPPAILSGSLMAESSWWTDFLDFIFNVDTSSKFSDSNDQLAE